MAGALWVAQGHAGSSLDIPANGVQHVAGRTRRSQAESLKLPGGLGVGGNGHKGNERRVREELNRAVERPDCNVEVARTPVQHPRAYVHYPLDAYVQHLRAYVQHPLDDLRHDLRKDVQQPLDAPLDYVQHRAGLRPIPPPHTIGTLCQKPPGAEGQGGVHDLSADPRGLLLTAAVRLC
jgi:hypothetical protein